MLVKLVIVLKETLEKIHLRLRVRTEVSHVPLFFNVVKRPAFGPS